MNASVYLTMCDVVIDAVDVDVKQTKYEMDEGYDFVTIGNVFVQRELIQAIEFGN